MKRPFLHIQFSAWLRVLPAALVVALAVAACRPPPPSMVPGSAPFAWQADDRWTAFDAALHEAMDRGCASVDGRLLRTLASVDSLSTVVATHGAAADAASLRALQDAFWTAAPLAAVCRDRIGDLQRGYARLHHAVSTAARGWTPVDRASRETMYRLLYGGRSVLEEAILLGSADDADAAVVSPAPVNRSVASTEWLGVTVQSGDLFLSRGTLASSALIARGSDFPGVFSHVALLHVDPDTGDASFVETFAETGAEVHTAAFYTSDTKRRILILRPRTDLPAISTDLTLPHRAAQAALETVQARHIGFDFKLDVGDRDRLFCSEIPYYAYSDLGVTLWATPSTVSRPGLMRWLYGMGARHFSTFQPSDLEYDPNLEVAGEWTDLDGLWTDHLDAAAADALFESADAGADLRYPLWMVPVAAAMKAWSWTKNRFGMLGPLPDGSRPIQALRYRDFKGRHSTLVAELAVRARDFERRHGHRPVYDDLLVLARQSLLR